MFVKQQGSRPRKCLHLTGWLRHSEGTELSPNWGNVGSHRTDGVVESYFHVEVALNYAIAQCTFDAAGLQNTLDIVEDAPAIPSEARL